MVDSRIENLLSEFRSGSIDRRSFVLRAMALGLSASAIGSYSRALAQDATPDASPAGALGPDTVGMVDVEHITTTDLSLIHI